MLLLPLTASGRDPCPYCFSVVIFAIFLLHSIYHRGHNHNHHHRKQYTATGSRLAISSAAWALAAVGAAAFFFVAYSLATEDAVIILGTMDSYTEVVFAFLQSRSVIWAGYRTQIEVQTQIRMVLIHLRSHVATLPLICGVLML
jgi:hypothetical protein